MDDAALFARIANGDEHAIETLAERYGGAMRAVAMRVTRSESVADEVVQDALLAVWRDPTKYDPTRALGPWLLTLTRYKAIDAVRRAQVVQRHTADVDLELREAPGDVHDEVWLGIRRERLHEAIRQLGDDQRRALELAFLGGLTHVEVAEREGIPLGTAKTRIRSALLKLRDSLSTSLDETIPSEATSDPPAPARTAAPVRIPATTATGASGAGRAPPIRPPSANEPDPPPNPRPRLT